MASSRGDRTAGHAADENTAVDGPTAHLDKSDATGDATTAADGDPSALSARRSGRPETDGTPNAHREATIREMGYRPAEELRRLGR